jgi:hypothetical protein
MLIRPTRTDISLRASAYQYTMSYDKYIFVLNFYAFHDLSFPWPLPLLRLDSFFNSSSLLR